MAANFEKDLGIDTWTLFEIKLAGQKSRVIIFQDSVSDFNSSSEEGKKHLENY